jgi:hypothetical protein
MRVGPPALRSGRTKLLSTTKRLKVYRSVLDFGAHVSSRGPGIAEENVWRFHEAVQLSEFYFDGKIHDVLEFIFKDALSLLSKNDQWQMKADLPPEECKQLSKERHPIARKLRDDCFAVCSTWACVAMR